MIWLYLLKERSEVSGVIKLFSVQFFTSIRVLRTDNALEYMKNDVSLLCFKNGIIHQISCSHTFQQNGIADANRHILDVAKIMIHMHVPKYLCANDVLSVSHLINMMPSFVIRGKIPFSCLYPNKSVFSVAPRVFSCTYFVHNLPSDLDKLSPRSIKCVFVGYSRTLKGYRFYVHLSESIVC